MTWRRDAYTYTRARTQQEVTRFCQKADWNKFIYLFRDFVNSVSFPESATATPRDISFYVQGLPADGVDILVLTFARTVDFADDFAGSNATVGVNPTATAEYDVQKNGVSIGHISISTGGVATFVTDGTTAQFVDDDYLTIVAPTPQDATLADVSITLVGSEPAA